MSKVKGKKFHHAGADGTDASVFTECVKDGSEPVIVRVERATPGKPLRLGESIVQIKSVDDEHYEMEEVTAAERSGKGPAMVSSKGYRAGWERTFGSNGIN